jgi:hypothetical protein
MIKRVILILTEEKILINYKTFEEVEHAGY